MKQIVYPGCIQNLDHVAPVSKIPGESGYLLFNIVKQLVGNIAMPDADANPQEKSTEKEWSPEPATLAPFNFWPLRPLKLFKWLFGFPGFLWPENVLLLGPGPSSRRT